MIRPPERSTRRTTVAERRGSGRSARGCRPGHAVNSCHAGPVVATRRRRARAFDRRRSVGTGRVSVGRAIAPGATRTPWRAASWTKGPVSGVGTSTHRTEPPAGTSTRQSGSSARIWSTARRVDVSSVRPSLGGDVVEVREQLASPGAATGRRTEVGGQAHVLRALDEWAGPVSHPILRPPHTTFDRDPAPITDVARHRSASSGRHDPRR